MARQIKGAGARIEYMAFAAAKGILAALPLRAAMRIGTALGTIAMQTDRVNRPIAMRNLEIAFPDADLAARFGILRGMYQNWGRMAAEWSHFGEINRDNIDRFAVYDDLEYLDYLKRTIDGRGILCLTGHFGNFELMAAAHSLNGFPTAIVQRPLRNPLMAQAINASRMRFGGRIITRKGVGRQILGLLRSNCLVGFALDLDVRKGVFVDFFGRKACTSDGLARLAMVTGVPVVPAFIVRQGDAMPQRIKILPPVEIVTSGDNEQAVTENTQRFTTILEGVIRRYPDHWNWIHRRWKTRPPGEKRFY